MSAAYEKIFADDAMPCGKKVFCAKKVKSKCKTVKDMIKHASKTIVVIVFAVLGLKAFIASLNDIFFIRVIYSLCI